MEYVMKYNFDEATILRKNVGKKKMSCRYGLPIWILRLRLQ